MSTRLLLAAALLLPALPALPASAQSLHQTHEVNGALAGRSPAHAYRAIAAQPCRTTPMHSLPAGKPHVYGTHAIRGADCAADKVTARPAPAGVHAPD